MNVESVGKTVEEALEAALKELNLKKEELRKVGEKADELDEKQKAFNNRVKEKWNDTVDSVKESGDKVRNAVNEKVETATAVSAAVKNTLAERKNKRSSSENVKEFVVDDAVVDEAKEFLAKIFKAMKIEVVMEKFVNKKDGCVNTDRRWIPYSI